MTDPTSRPWWKKRRWAAATALWLAVTYPLSFGPIGYCHVRGWLPVPVSALQTVYAPLIPLLPANPEDSIWGRYAHWWDELAFRHEMDARTTSD